MADRDSQEEIGVSRKRHRKKQENEENDKNFVRKKKRLNNQQTIPYENYDDPMHDDIEEEEEESEENTTPGTIESINLKNFMCHTTLELEFKTGINVIHGQNGVGKSAIVSAIQIGLGAGVGATHRAESLGDFIQTGKHKCTVELKMSNTGDDAYEHSEYGNHLYIRRHIVKSKTRGSVSSYFELKGSQPSRAKYKRVKTRDITHIMSHFNIHLSNPAVLLTQDVSKTFLMSSTSREKFDYFMKATQLAQINELHTQSTSHREDLNIQHGNMKVTLEEEKKDLEKLNDRLFALSELRKMKDKLGRLKQHRAWLQLEAYQHQVEEKIQFLTEMDEKNTSYKDLEKALTDKNVKLQESKKEIRQQCEQLKLELRDLNENKHKKSENIKALRHEKQKHNVNKQQIEREISRETRQIERIKEKIQAEEQASQDVQQKTLDLNINYIEKIKLDIKEMEENIKENRETLTTQQHEQDQHRLKYDNNAKQYRQAKLHHQHLVQAKDKLKNLEKSEVLYYDKNMNLLLQNIMQNINQFSKPPIGPVGLLLSVSNRSWAPIAEYHFRKHKDLFIVNNQQDKKHLDLLIQRHHVKVNSTIVMNIDARQYDPNKFYPNMQRHLFRLSDLMIVNKSMLDNEMYPIPHNMQELEGTIQRFLFDYVDSFRVILEEDSAKASDIMFSRSYPDVKGVYSLEGVYHYMRGNKPLYLTNTRIEKSVWSTDREQQLKQVQQQVESIQGELLDVEQSMDAIKQDQSNLKSLLNESDVAIRQTERDYKEFCSHLQDFNFVLREKQTLVENLKENPSQRQIDELKMQRDAHTVKKTSLTNDLSLYEDRVSKLEDDIENEKSILHAIDPQCLGIEQQLREEARLLEDADTRIEANRSRVIELNSEMRQAKARLPSIQNEIRSIESTMASFIEKHDLHDDPRSDADRASSHSISDLDGLIALTERHIEENSSTNLYAQYEEVKHAFELQLSRTSAFENHVHSIKELFEQYRNALSQRSTKFQALKQFIKKNTSHIFNALLEYRHHSGTVDIAPRDQKLTVHVTIGGRRGEKEGTFELSTLSGGERSYSTSALLLSLWVNVDSPLRIVDEIDVYMDDKHRHLTYELIVETVKQHFIPQVILVTPHDPSLFSKWSNVVHFIVLT